MKEETLPKPETAPDTESDFNPFLNVTNVKPGAPVTLNLTGKNRTLNGQYGKQVVCEVRFNKTLYDWGITINKPNYRILFERFGAKLKNWKGDVLVERRPPMEKGRSPFLAVVHARVNSRAQAPARRKKR